MLSLHTAGQLAVATLPSGARPTKQAGLKREIRARWPLTCLSPPHYLACFR